jgi:DNA-binding IclR family transcriptional regulator
MSVLAARLGREPVVVGDLRLGYREHAHAKASGKAILAFSPHAQIDRYLSEHPMEALTPHTVVTRPRLARQLSKIRRLGFAEEVEEYALGVACVAAPVLRAEGTAVGALAISVPLERFTERRSALVDEVADAGRRASALLGSSSTRPENAEAAAG